MSLTQIGYKNRVVDARLGEMLQTFGAVCVEGPRWCGKTWASLNQAQSVVFIGDPAGDFQNRRLAELDPLLVLSGEPPRLIDEWQDVPGIWDAVKFQVDRRQEKGRFLLTGSSTPQRKGVRHSGVGRIGILRMHPMTLFESGDSSGAVSLSGLFESPIEPVNTGEVKLEHLVDLIVRGGWPESIGMQPNSAQMLARSYIDLTVEDDASRIDGSHRDSHKLRLLLRSLARNESTLASKRTLQKDMMQYDDETLAIDTVTDYISVLKRLFIIWEQESFSANMRSSARVGKKPKRHLADPSLAVAVLGVTADALIADLNALGFLFEALCARDLAVYADAMDGALRHYRDSLGREVDAIVELPDGRYGAFEVKVGANQIDGAAAHLLKFGKMMASEGNRAPEVLAVVCGMSSAAYTRPDGVSVVPITALRP